MNLDVYAEYIGYVIILTGSMLLTVLFILAVSYLVYTFSGNIQSYLVDSMGGWKTFLEYRKWYHKNNR